MSIQSMSEKRMRTSRVRARAEVKNRSCTDVLGLFA